MKLRIRGNSVRLRLTQSDLARLAETGSVEEAVEFVPPSRFVYALEITENTEPPGADFEHDRLRVHLPVKEAASWINSDETGIEAEQRVGENKLLKIIVEKDFACLKPRAGEDDRDAFPHPPEDNKC